MLLPGRTCNEESILSAMRATPKSSRKEFINQLRGQSRSQLVETCLELHSRIYHKEYGAVKVPIATAIGMAALASPVERRKLKKGSPDLFEREATPRDIDAGQAAVLSMYRQIDMSEPGAAERRIEFRKKFPNVFK